MVATFAAASVMAYVAPGLALCVILAIGCANAVRLGNTASFGMPATLVTSFAEYRAERMKIEALSKNRRDVSGVPAAARDRDVDVVFIIGEAARPDHFHDNGCGRQTSPRLEAAGAGEVHQPDGELQGGHGYDADLLPHLDGLLAGGAGGRLAVLHAIGSHWRYDRHYPPAFKAFTPTCGKSVPSDCPRAQVINSYDNTILYADWFVGEVIERLKSLNALVIYASDHGESLGEKGVYAHWAESKNTREQLDAALFVWTSDEHERRNPGTRERLKKNAADKVTQPQLFHTVLDCAGVSGDAIDRGKSLCN